MENTTEKLIKMGLKVGKKILKRLKWSNNRPCSLLANYYGDNVTLAPRVHILAHMMPAQKTI